MNKKVNIQDSFKHISSLFKKIKNWTLNVQIYMTIHITSGIAIASMFLNIIFYYTYILYMLSFTTLGFFKLLFFNKFLLLFLYLFYYGLTFILHN